MNGAAIDVRGVDPHTTVLAFLRSRGLTGTKEGCGEGECGACALAVVTRDHAGRPRYESVNSCLLLVGQAAGRELVSVEGIADGESLHPVQAAMVEMGGSQCGYCTPGFVVSMFAEYYRPDRTGYDPESIAGNLCRCTGYRPIRDAMRALPVLADGGVSNDRHATCLAKGSTKLESVSVLANGRAFHRPTKLAELWPLLTAHPKALLVGGGTDVVVEMNQRHRREETIIALDGLPELRTFSRTDASLDIGAGVPLREIEERLHGTFPLFDQVLPLFSSRLIRSRATLGGNIANASPIGDSPPVLLALDASVVLASAKGERTVPLEQFFTGYRRTVLAPGEIVLRVHVPLPHPKHGRFYKVSKRVLDDISTVAGAFAVDTDAAGRVTSARFAFGGVAATPVRLAEAERAVVGAPWSEATADRAAVLAEAAVKPMDDHRGSANYRRAMVRELLSKFGRETAEGGA
ncbi:MAG: FAD binding domain-containing protein [Myxococcales bacterium]|nr:FAD binding domain-containing protein [Myxococcales bacterium]